MKRAAVALALALMFAGCGQEEAVGDVPIGTPEAAPSPRAELYIRETIEPELVSPDSSLREEEAQIETSRTKPVDAGTEEPGAAEAEEGGGEADSEGEADPEYEHDTRGDSEADQDGDVNAGREMSEVVDYAEINDAGGDPDQAEDSTGEAGTDEGLCEGPDSEQPAMHLWGVCTITHYCPCSRCCGSWAGGATASGTTPTAGRTVAADLPFGTRLMINGHEYVVEDRGVGGMWVDIFVNGHQEALDLGMYKAEVYIIDG